MSKVALEFTLSLDGFIADQPAVSLRPISTPPTSDGSGNVLVRYEVHRQ